MYRYMAGIASDENNPGFKNVILQPTLDTGIRYNSEERINHVKASYNSVYGEIKTEWNSRNGKLTSYKVKVPANTTAILYLPVDKAVSSTFETIPGVLVGGMDTHNGQEVLKLALVSGEYEFAVINNKLTASHDEDYAINPEIEFPTVFPESEKGEYCKCICHKSGILNMVYKILRFLWKLFKIKSVYGCSALLMLLTATLGSFALQF